MLVNAIVPLTSALPTVAVEEEFVSARAYASASKSEATQRTYRSDAAIFRTWCDKRGLQSLPATPDTVAAFLASEAEANVAVATLTRRAAAIRYMHKLAGLEPPTSAESVKATMSGIRRVHGVARNRKAPATAERVRAMVAPISDDMGGLRDRAILLLGFAGAFWRSDQAFNGRQTAYLRPFPSPHADLPTDYDLAGPPPSSRFSLLSRCKQISSHRLLDGCL